MRNSVTTVGKKISIISIEKVKELSENNVTLLAHALETQWWQNQHNHN